MLDLKRYYYNVEISKQSFLDMTSKFYDNENNVIERINSCVYNIIKIYSELCGCESTSMLPIGFLPSLIISNYYLNIVDNKISQVKGTVYYGRYVDDMILVTEIEDTMEFKRNILEIGNQYVSDYMISLLENAEILSNTENDQYVLCNFNKLKIQKEKFRFFYIDRDGYDLVIEKIQKDICKNASEFNYIPESAVDELDTSVLKVEREDTVNKLRSINKADIDKYELSKLIGKNIMMSKFAQNEANIKFAKSLEQVLNYKEILGNYTLWESILNYYVLNNYTQGISYLTGIICSSIESMDEDSNKCEEDEYLKNTSIERVGDSLIYYYFSCLTRSTAMSWGGDIERAIDDSVQRISSFSKYGKYNYLYSLNNIYQTRKEYCNARMINKNLLATNIENCISFFEIDNSKYSCKLFSLKAYMDLTVKVEFGIEKHKYTPYILSPFDILYGSLINQIRENKEELFSDKECVEILVQQYAKNFGNPQGQYIAKYIMADSFDSENHYIKLYTKKRFKDFKVKIAVANVKMDEADIENIFKEERRDISERCSEIGRIVNEAIRFKADMLVFPEAYIPLEYLKILQAKVAEHNMVIIAGIEHIKKDNLVYNLTATLLPIKNQYMSYAVPFFHQKKYFSPHELEIAQKYGSRPAKGQGHTLFNWGDMYFATYCCYELTSINLRHIFQGMVDIIFGVEWNRDTYYFGNIMESLSRDIYCYCVQANMSEYGDSRIVQPTKKDYMDIMKVKGGINASVLIGEIDLEQLHKNQNGEGASGNKEIYKPLPAGWNLKKNSNDFPSL